ncbi:MAG: hypothetical protein FOGNACKC_02293 [Anaerolineae bacterium]|nr:hypothetical protein [Anaerolineae bacterium]
MKNPKIMIPTLIAVLAIVATAIAAFVFYPRLALAGGEHGWLKTMVGGGISSYESRLATALNISVADLQTAQEKARTTAIERAVEQGQITQAQADRILLTGPFGLWSASFFRPPHLGDVPGRFGNAPDDLAAALGISESELLAADQSAETAGVQEALDAGLIAQAQADSLLARIRLKSYVNRDAMLAEALGLPLADLRSTLRQGKSLTTLLGEQNTDAVTVRQKMVVAYQQAISQAVSDGAITQAQADNILSRGFDQFDRGWPGDGPRDQRGFHDDRRGGQGEFDRRGPK